MPGRQFNRLPATGPMAQQAEQEHQAAKKAAGQEYDIEKRAIDRQVLSPEQRNNQLAKLHGKHSLRALQMDRDWNQRMTRIQQYEKLGTSGAITPGQSSRAQYGLSGYNMPQQKRPDYWSEHRNLIQQRERIQAEMLDPWDNYKGKWRIVESVHTKGRKKGQVKKRGREATPQEIQQIEAARGIIGELDQYEFSLLEQMDPQYRKINQLSRAMAMGPRTQQTPGVGGRRPRIPLGTGTPEDPLRGYAPEGREKPRFETPGYKMTREKAIEQARQQLGSQANKERVLALAKQIYGSAQ